MATAGPKFAADASPHERLVAVGKHLFSALGYENTSTSLIAREAKTSESQLIKHFGSKEGLLEAIFESGWAKLRMQLATLQTLSSSRKQLQMLLRMVVQLFNEDHELRDLMLLEGRRIRREGKMIMLTASYTDFVAFVDRLVESAQQEGGAQYPPQLIRSSLIGTFEGLLRDSVLHERYGYSAEYTIAEAEQFVFELVDRLLAPA